MIVNYLRAVGVTNQLEFRNQWLETILRKISEKESGLCLDVGAGEMPYKDLVNNLGFKYFSHDFAQYSPSVLEEGLHDDSWPKNGYDIICDIQELSGISADIALLTEVLEHVPDPREALKAVLKVVSPGGNVLISVPFNSRMHQAPHWYSSGLSPYWFTFHARELGYSIEEMTIVGDFVDYIRQESLLCFEPFQRFQRFAYRGWSYLEPYLRERLSHPLLSSGGLGVLIHIQRNDF